MADPAGKSRQLKLQALIRVRPLRYASATLLVVAVCAGALVINDRSGQTVSAATAVSAPSLGGQHAGGGPEDRKSVV